MNAESADFDPGPPVAPTTPVVVVVAEHDILDAAVVSLVEKLGFVAVIHDVDSPGARPTGYAVVAITRERRRYVPLASMPAYRMATIVGIGLAEVTSTPASRIATAAGVAQLRAVLADAARHYPQLEIRDAGSRTPAEPVVHVTQRELEVLRTYVLGETISATAHTHSIGESTVREHYRRVKERYTSAGRPVCNKAQLLLALVSDGWLSSDLSGETDKCARLAERRAEVEGVRNA